jgi:hypothetical protein
VGRSERRLGERIFGEHVEPGGPGAGVQLWWRVPPGRPIIGVAVSLELLQPPVSARRYQWGLQAGLVDRTGRRLDDATVAVVHEPSGELRHELALDVRGTAAVALVDPAMWMELEEPPDDPTVVVRWSSPVWFSDDGPAAVDAVMVTFPSGREWRRLDVVTDDVGVLQVTNTRRTAANMAVLQLPPAR